MQIKLLYFVLNITISILFFRFTFFEWNKLDPNLRSAASLNIFRKEIVKAY